VGPGGLCYYLVVIGTTIGHYKIEETLGKGGMGVVYRALDTRLGRPVALKFLPPEFTSDPERKRRFLQEARAAAAVNHPAIAQIYEVDESEGGTFIAMELVDGRSIRALLQNKELDLLGALHVAIQVAGGLAKAHEAGIVHRDIKPENIMLTKDGHAKILDFGLAKLAEPAAPEGGDALSRLETVAHTQTGIVMGTLRYMSPEQARGQTVDHKSDIFSLGVVIYEMVTGQLPFSGASALDTLHAIAFEETRPITALRANLPPSLQRVITKCLRKRPEDRYGEAKELAGDLGAVQREVESGISQGVPLGDLVSEKLRGLTSLNLGKWALPVFGIGVLLLLAVFFIRGHESGPFLFFFAFAALGIYRRFRNRRYNLIRRFTSKVRRLPEVRFIAVQGGRVTVSTDKALAKTYVRINSLMEEVNARLFFGDPYQVVVRDSMTPDETRSFFTGPGILYVRDDVTHEPAPPQKTTPNETLTRRDG
jgi:predicted Ser/Thr protein kinase